MTRYKVLFQALDWSIQLSYWFKLVFVHLFLLKSTHLRLNFYANQISMISFSQVKASELRKLGSYWALWNSIGNSSKLTKIHQYSGAFFWFANPNAVSLGIRERWRFSWTDLYRKNWNRWVKIVRIIYGVYYEFFPPHSSCLSFTLLTSFISFSCLYGLAEFFSYSDKL
jgi:hypothetical protein